MSFVKGRWIAQDVGEGSSFALVPALTSCNCRTHACTYYSVGNPVQIGGVQLTYDDRSRLARVSLPIAQGELQSPVNVGMGGETASPPLVFS